MIIMPSHRHATPSGPWPFLDVGDAIDHAQITSSAEPRRQTHESETEYPFHNEADDWHNYPQALFPNWTLVQQKKSGVSQLIRSSRRGYRSRFGTKLLARPECSVYVLHMQRDGRFSPTSNQDAQWKVKFDTEGEHLWEALTQPPDASTRCQIFFIDSLSGPVLQMFGTRFTIDPFFFSSSMSWIPSRYAELTIPGRSDHITFSLTYITMLPWTDTVSTDSDKDDSGVDYNTAPMFHDEQLIIDTHSPLLLQSSSRVVVHDLIGVHAVRHGPSHPSPSTIITYVPPTKGPSAPSTSASTLHRRTLATGRSIYWSDLYRTTADATLPVLAELWYPLYAWDETLEFLTTEVIWLEAHTLSTIDSTRSPMMSTGNSAADDDAHERQEEMEQEDGHTQTYMHTHQLHVMRAHLLHYKELIEDFRKTVQFLVDTPHPAMEDQTVLQRECRTVLNHIERLEGTRAMLDSRVGNAMDLAFSSVNNEDSKRMQALSEAALRDSAAMKQVAYITMIYLPASFSAAFFGMNTKEINPEGSRGLRISTYFAIAIPLTLFTIWIMTLFYRGEKRRREIEDPVEIRRALKWKNLSLGTPKLVVQALVGRLAYPVMLFFQALSFTPKREKKKDEWAESRSAFASARSSMRSGRPQRGTIARSSVQLQSVFPSPVDDSGGAGVS